MIFHNILGVCVPKVLVVDDSPTILARLSDGILTGLGFEVVKASSKKQTLEVIVKHKDFDIALLDLGLPDASGEEIVDLVKKFKIPIVVLTGSEDPNTRQMIVEKDIVDYVIKDRSFAIEYAVSVVKRFISNKNHHILIVDDSKVFGYTIQKLCLKYNLKADISTCGEEALDIIKRNPEIKLVFVDYMMPGMDGLQLTTELRKIYSKEELSIVALSCSEEEDILAKFLKFGANDFIAKGCSNEEFFARLNKGLETIELFEETKALANTDYLTGLYNRRYFFDKATKLYYSLKMAQIPCAVAMIDIDKFKPINDTYGHEMGDVALKSIASLFNEFFAELNVVVARFGGEEFCVFIHNISQQEAFELVDNFRKVVESKVITNNDISLQLTISAGMSTEFANNLDEMIQNADRALYEAKESGRNKVVVN